MMLGDMGADVLLIEAPADGKLAATAVVSRGADAEKMAAYNMLSRNKRSIVLNLREPDAREIFYKLADTADVVLEGFRPGVVKRLGVDYDTLSERNPRIVYCSLSGFGQTGPYSQLVGHDINYISIGGALGMIGWPDTPPAIPMNIIADFAGGGMHAAYGILAALMARERTGRGQYVDIAMSDGVLYLLASMAGNVLMGGDSPSRGSDRCSTDRCRTTTCTSAATAAGSASAASSRTSSSTSARRWSASSSSRTSTMLRSEPRSRRTLRSGFSRRTRDEWFEILKQTDICVGPVYSLDEALKDPHNLAREMVVEVDHPTLGKVKTLGIGTKLSDTPGAVRRRRLSPASTPTRCSRRSAMTPTRSATCAPTT